VRVALRTIVAWAITAGLCPVCIAGPTEDHEAGLQSFQRGDIVGAMPPLRRAADAGHVPSMVLLAYILDNAGMTKEALPLYRRAAVQGDAEAEAALASLLIEGRSTAPDPREAFLLYERAAGRGHPLAAQAVADAYLRNDTRMLGEDATDAKALPALRRAAEAGYVPAAERLVIVYQQGLLGATADEAEAARWQARVSAARPRASGAKK
jgi:TPR repeat protein